MVPEKIMITLLFTANSRSFARVLVQGVDLANILYEKGLGCDATSAEQKLAAMCLKEAEHTGNF